MWERAILAPTSNVTINGYQSLGCRKDNLTSRVLSHFTMIPGGAANMSVAACTTACAWHGFSLAGLQWGQGM